MEKKYIVGGLAILGAIALVAYLRKPKRNSEGFFNAGGGAYGLGCKVCERENGTTYFAKFGGCASGDSCIISVRPKKALTKTVS